MERGSDAQTPVWFASIGFHALVELLTRFTQGSSQRRPCGILPRSPIPHEQGTESTTNGQTVVTFDSSAPRDTFQQPITEPWERHSSIASRRRAIWFFHSFFMSV